MYLESIFLKVLRVKLFELSDTDTEESFNVIQVLDHNLASVEYDLFSDCTVNADWTVIDHLAVVIMSGISL